MTKFVEGQKDARGLKIGVVVSRFNQFVTEKLLEGARDGFVSHGGADENLEIVRVPGAFEIPLAVEKMAATGKYDALVCLGAVIRGDTPHFDYVAGECAAGIQRVALDTGTPVVFGVLTIENLDQAFARTGGSEGHKGAEAARTAVEMVSLLRQLPTEEP